MFRSAGARAGARLLVVAATALVPVAALAGGAIGSLAGLRRSLVVGGAGMLVGAALILRRDVFAVRNLTTAPG